MKKVFLLGMMGLFLAACGQEGAKPEAESSAIEPETVLYSGTVMEKLEMDKPNLYVENLNPVDRDDVPGFNEVVLLLNADFPIEDKDTGKAVDWKEIKEGDTVEVTLKKNTPTTRSLPPQIPGSAIIKIVWVQE